MYEIEQEALDNITKAPTMINCWTEFNTILKDRSIYYRDNKNYNDNYFILVLDQNIRSSIIGNEKIDYKSFLKGYDLLKEFFLEFNKG